MSEQSETFGIELTAREAMAVRVALIFGDPSVSGAPRDPTLESAKAKLKTVEARSLLVGSDE